jgi:hypothetical protein
MCHFTFVTELSDDGIVITLFENYIL